MGRGLSEQQKSILIWLWNEESGFSKRSRVPQLQHEHNELNAQTGRPRKQTDREVESASVSRAITRLEKRGLLKREDIERTEEERRGWSEEPLALTEKYIMLTAEGLELAKQLSGDE